MPWVLFRLLHFFPSKTTTFININCHNIYMQTTVSGPGLYDRSAAKKRKRLADFKRFPAILDGRFELKQVLGLGGMAGIWLAFDKYENSQVIVKINDNSARKVRKKRITEEVNTLRGIDHPNVVSLKGAGTFMFTDAKKKKTREIAYEVMELMAGEDLGNYIGKYGAIPWEAARDFALQACDGLGALHSRGVVHRDVKPENIFITVEGNIVVCDFGISRFTKLLGEEEDPPGGFFGTPQYMPPERLKGEKEGFRSDIYSMGVVLYEMLCGTVPFRSGNILELANQIENETPLPPSAYAPGMNIPKEAEDIVSIAMMKDPSGRYQSMHEMMDAIMKVVCTPELGFGLQQIFNPAIRLLGQMNTLETTVQDTIPMSSPSIPTQEIM